MVITDYDYRLPPFYPQIRKSEQSTWGKILELLTPTNDIDFPIRNKDLEEKVVLKNEHEIIEWFKVKLEYYLSSIFKDYNPFETHNRVLRKESILPQLIEQNRFYLDKKWIIPFIRIYIDYLLNNSFDNPGNLSNRFIKLLNDSYENKQIKLSGKIIQNVYRNRGRRKSIDKFFPNYQYPMHPFLLIIDTPNKEAKFEDLYKLEWSVICEHINYYADQPRKVEAILEQAFLSFRWKYGENHIHTWLKHTQFLLDKHQNYLDYLIAYTTRKWVNTTIEYFNRSRTYLPKRFGEEINPDIERLVLLDYEQNKEEAEQFFNIIFGDSASDNYTTTEQALIIYLSEEYHEISVSGKGSKIFIPLVKTGSHTAVYNDFRAIKRYLDPKKESYISKDVFESGIRKILRDEKLKKYHSRAKSLLINPH